MMMSKSLIVVPETFQNPPENLVAEAAHFARMAINARLGGADFYRPKAAESVGIPTGDSMGQAIWGTEDVFRRVYRPDIQAPQIQARKDEIIAEAMAVLEAALKLKAGSLKPEMIDEDFWRRWSDTELIELIVEAGKSGILDSQRAGGWDLKRHVKVHRDADGITRYVKGWTPLGVDAVRCAQSAEEVQVHEEKPPTRPEKIVLATVGADAHVNGINVVREAFQDAGYEIVYLRGMNLPETVAEVVAEVNADAVGVSNLLGLGLELFPRVGKRLQELGLREKTVVWAGGRIAEKEEEHQFYETKKEKEGVDFLGVDAFFGPDSTPRECVETISEMMREKRG